MQSSPYGESVISAQTCRLKIIKKKKGKKKGSDLCTFPSLFHTTTCCCCEQEFFQFIYIIFLKPNWGHGKVLNTDFKYVSPQIRVVIITVWG